MQFFGKLIAALTFLVVVQAAAVERTSLRIRATMTRRYLFLPWNIGREAQNSCPVGRDVDSTGLEDCF